MAVAVVDNDIIPIAGTAVHTGGYHFPISRRQDIRPGRGRNIQSRMVVLLPVKDPVPIGGGKLGPSRERPNISPITISGVIGQLFQHFLNFSIQFLIQLFQLFLPCQIVPLNFFLFSQISFIFLLQGIQLLLLLLFFTFGLAQIHLVLLQFGLRRIHLFLLLF